MSHLHVVDTMAFAEDVSVRVICGAADTKWCLQRMCLCESSAALQIQNGVCRGCVCVSSSAALQIERRLQRMCLCESLRCCRYNGVCRGCVCVSHLRRCRYKMAFAEDVSVWAICGAADTMVLAEDVSV